MAPVPGRALIDRVIRRVHAAVQEGARSRTEFELGSITLRLLTLLRQGREVSLDLACVEAHGCHFQKWQERAMARSSALAWEFQRLIPDYDPAEAKHAAMVKAGEVRRLGEGGRAMFAWEEPREAGPEKPQLVPRVSEKSKTRNAG
jgi:hypothetical protein